jgi:SAM-dependent methyltransferase
MEQTVKELHTQRSKLWDASIENHLKYIDSSTGIFETKWTENRPCPVCKEDNCLKIFNKEGGEYVKCLTCHMIYINPVFTDSAIVNYYQTNHCVQSQIVENADEFYVNLYNQGLDTIETFANKGDILDIGCSSGVFLDTAKKREWSTNGVELNVQEYEFAKNKNHNVYNALLETLHFEKNFDAITMWDVFEHIKEGEFYLNTMKKLLNKRGVIFLQIPSSDSLAAKILQEKCNMFDGLEHVNIYGVSTISRLAQKCGLKILHIQSVISEIGVINNYLDYEHPYLGNTTNKTFIPNLIDEKDLHDKLLGYKLQVTLGVEE